MRIVACHTEADTFWEWVFNWPAVPRVGETVGVADDVDGVVDEVKWQDGDQEGDEPYVWLHLKIDKQAVALLRGDGGTDEKRDAGAKVAQDG